MKRKSNGSGCGCGTLIVLGLFCLLFVNWTESNLEWVLGLIKGSPVDVPFWIAFILTFFTNIFGFGFNICCELIKLVM